MNVIEEPVTIGARKQMVAAGPAREVTAVRRVWVENLSILLAHKVLIIIVTVIVTAATGIYAFMMLPNWYKANAVVLPARKSGSLLDNLTGGISSTIKDLGITKLGGNSSSDGFYSPLALLDSRELHETMIKKFDLQTQYKSNSMEEALREFSAHVGGDLTEIGDIAITFEDVNPQRAATIANALVDGINDINSRLAVEEAKQNFVFVDQRYQKNLSDLDSAEQALGTFQSKYGVYALPEQAKAELAGIAAIEQQKFATEIQLHTAEQVYGPQSTEAQLQRTTLGELAGKLGEMNSGADAKAPSYIVPTKVLPTVALQYLRLMREVEIQSKLKAYMLPAYEQARLDQTKRTLAFVTLDHAVAPMAKSKPHRSVLMLIAFISSMVLSSFVILIAANTRRTLARFSADRRALTTL
jgi:tyrosine-protein kinase Etk/Wzc